MATCSFNFEASQCSGDRAGDGCDHSPWTEGYPQAGLSSFEIFFVRHRPRLHSPLPPPWIPTYRERRAAAQPTRLPQHGPSLNARSVLSTARRSHRLSKLRAQALHCGQVLLEPARLLRQLGRGEGGRQDEAQHVGGDDGGSWDNPAKSAHDQLDNPRSISLTIHARRSTNTRRKEGELFRI